MKGKQPSQKMVISRLSELAQFAGFCEISMRKKPKNTKNSEAKKFYPDLIARRASGKGIRIFEVEKTVNNNTLFKSLVSLLSYQAEMDADNIDAFLVIPKKKYDFAAKCLSQIEYLFKYFSKKNLGAFPATHTYILDFDEVTTKYKNMLSWKQRRDRNEKTGAPPKFDVF